ncbi:hypothetical protein V8E53_002872 [Lactarius tabidus]
MVRWPSVRTVSIHVQLTSFGKKINRGAVLLEKYLERMNRKRPTVCAMFFVDTQGDDCETFEITMAKSMLTSAKRNRSAPQGRIEINRPTKAHRIQKEVQDTITLLPNGLYRAQFDGFIANDAREVASGKSRNPLGRLARVHLHQKLWIQMRNLFCSSGASRARGDSRVIHPQLQARRPVGLNADNIPFSLPFKTAKSIGRGARITKRANKIIALVGRFDITGNG